MTKNQKKGLMFLIGPFILLIVIIILWVFISFFAASSNGSGSGLMILNVILGLLGLVSVLLIFLGFVLGIYFLTKKEDKELIADLKKEKEFKGLKDEELIYLGSWSWGAFFGTWIWLLGNKLTTWSITFIVALALGILSNLIFLLKLDPLVLITISGVFSGIVMVPLGIANLVLWIYLSIKGRQLAWKKGWASFDQYKARQKQLIWVIVVGLILTFSISWGLQLLVSSQMTPNFSDTNYSDVYDNNDFTELEEACYETCYDDPSNDILDCIAKCSQ